MPPRMLVLVSPLSRIPVPIRQPEEWDGQTCFHCHRRIENDVAIYLVNTRQDESPVLTCRVCMRLINIQWNPCMWCGRPGRAQDTGDVFCQPCWTIYVAYVSDLVEGDTEERRLLQHVKDIIAEEEARAAQDTEAPSPTD